MGHMGITDNCKVEYMYEQIADQLERDILSGCYPEKRLPSEQNLALRYSVSRAVIREALKLLTERSLVTTVVGSGTYITKPDVENLSSVLDRITATHNFSVSDIIETRIILESNAAALAALNATPEELDIMDLIREKIKDPTLTTKQRAEMDFKFHMLICEASHNGLLTILAKAIGSMVKDLISINLEVGEANKEDTRHISHARILNAIRDRNPFAARSIVYSHLYSSKSLYEKYLSGKVRN